MTASYNEFFTAIFCVNVFYNQTYFGRTCITFLLFVCINAYAMKAFLDYVNTVDSDEALYIDFNVLWSDLNHS